VYQQNEVYLIQRRIVEGGVLTGPKG